MNAAATSRAPANHLAYAGCTLVALVALLATFNDLADAPLESAANIGTAAAAISLLSVVRATNYGQMSASAMYVFIFSLFHFGLTTPIGLGVLPTGRTEHAVRNWLFLPETVEAVLLAAAGCLACALGVRLALAARRTATLVCKSEDNTASALVPLGSVLLVACVAGWFLLVVSAGGWGLLVGSYRDMLDATATMPLPWVYLGMGLGLSLVAAAPSKRTTWLGLGAFGTFTAFAFPLGLRGEVLFPVSAALVVAARRGRRLPTAVWSLMVVAVLAVSAAAKDVRQSGIEHVDSSDFSLSPFDGLMELGSSLRPVTEVLTWQRAGESLAYGATYWAPIERALAKVVPGLERPRAEDDERLMNVVVMERAGPIGFSPIAEAAHNFDLMGVVLVFVFLGGILAHVDSWKAKPAALCLLGAILVPLLNNVRNAFTPVPAQLVVGVSLALAAVWVSRHFSIRARGRSVQAQLLEPRSPGSRHGKALL